jgi:hypothetical protein
MSLKASKVLPVASARTPPYGANAELAMRRSTSLRFSAVSSLL